MEGKVRRAGEWVATAIRHVWAFIKPTVVLIGLPVIVLGIAGLALLRWIRRQGEARGAYVRDKENIKRMEKAGDTRGLKEDILNRLRRLR